MSTSYFLRKAVDLEEVWDVYFANKGKTKGQSFIVEKVIELNLQDFDQFSNNLLDDYDFIRDNMDIMYIDKEDVRHCLLVKTQEAKDGYLIDSQGYDYARYIAYYPNWNEVANDR